MMNLTIAREFPELVDDKYYTDTILDKMSFEQNEVNIKDEIEQLAKQMKLIREQLNGSF